MNRRGARHAANAPSLSPRRVCLASSRARIHRNSCPHPPESSAILASIARDRHAVTRDGAAIACGSSIMHARQNINRPCISRKGCPIERPSCMTPPRWASPSWQNGARCRCKRARLNVYRARHPMKGPSWSHNRVPIVTKGHVKAPHSCAMFDDGCPNERDSRPNPNAFAYPSWRKDARFHLGRASPSWMRARLRSLCTRHGVCHARRSWMRARIKQLHASLLLLCSRSNRLRASLEALCTRIELFLHATQVASRVTPVALPANQVASRVPPVGLHATQPPSRVPR
jgi:hypothetical protein